MGSLGSAASSVLGTPTENDEKYIGDAIELPSANNVMGKVGQGISNAATTIKETAGSLQNKAETSFFGEMANNMVNGVKEIGKGALGTIENTSNLTNNAIKMATYKKCNPDFMENIGGIIDTCDRDNYIVIYNTIIEKLKLKKNNFRELVKKDIDALKPIDLEKENIITENENTLTIETAESADNMESPMNLLEKKIEEDSTIITKKTKKQPKKMKVKVKVKEMKKPKKMKVKEMKQPKKMKVTEMKKPKKMIVAEMKKPKETKKTKPVRKNPKRKVKDTKVLGMKYLGEPLLKSIKV